MSSFEEVEVVVCIVKIIEAKELDQIFRHLQLFEGTHGIGKSLHVFEVFDDARDFEAVERVVLVRVVC